MDDQLESGQRVTPLELFFDLVFVFAITQVTGFISRDPTWGGPAPGALGPRRPVVGVGRVCLLTNTLNPEEGAVRLAVFGSIAAMLIVRSRPRVRSALAA